MSLESGLEELGRHLAVDDRSVEWVDGVNGLTDEVTMNVLRDSPKVGYVGDEVCPVLQRAFDLLQGVDSIEACSVSDRVLSRLMCVGDYVRLC